VRVVAWVGLPPALCFTVVSFVLVVGPVGGTLPLPAALRLGEEHG